jgi:fatty acid desaturase
MNGANRKPFLLSLSWQLHSYTNERVPTGLGSRATLADRAWVPATERLERDQPKPGLGITMMEIRALVAELAVHRTWMYWLDFLCSIGCGYLAFVILSTHYPLSAVGVFAFLISTLSLYRAAVFTHELAHLQKNRFRIFRVVWNILFGIPCLIPSFLYEIHFEHHSPQRYGSSLDGEYISFARLPRRRAVSFVLASFLAAPVLLIRFLLLAPIGWLIPSFRTAIFSRVSALVIDSDYRRRYSGVPRGWNVQEVACFLWSLFLVWLFLRGTLSLSQIAEAYAVISAIAFLNALRVLAAHRYLANQESISMSITQQVLDSNNFPGRLAEFWAPLGLRYHAVHHLLPSLPYHALPEAYRRLMRSLPRDSPFRLTSRRSLYEALVEVFGHRHTEVEK